MKPKPCIHLKSLKIEDNKYICHECDMIGTVVDTPKTWVRTWKAPKMQTVLKKKNPNADVTSSGGLRANNIDEFFRDHAEEIKAFQDRQRGKNERANASACGRGDCGVSTGIHGGTTFGFGDLDNNGFWAVECKPCTRQNKLQEENDTLREALVKASEHYHETAEGRYHQYHSRFEMCPEVGCQSNSKALGNKRRFKCYFSNCRRTVSGVKEFCHEHND